MEANEHDQLKEAAKIIKKDEEKRSKRGDAYLDRVSYLVDKYRTALFFIFFQMIVILLLTFGYLSVKQSVIVEVVMPKVVKDSNYGELRVGISSANDMYYKVWGEEIVRLTVNTEPETMQENFNGFYSMLHPKIEKTYRKTFNKFVQQNVTNKITSKFEELKHVIERDGDHVTYSVKGVLQTNVDGFKNEKYLCNYSFGFEIVNYMLFIDQYKKKCEPIVKDEGLDATGSIMGSEPIATDKTEVKR